MKTATLCIPVAEKNSKILLGMKKRGFGKDKFNGFGGKLNPGESVAEAAVRELREEAGLRVDVGDLKKVAELTFTFPGAPDNSWDQVVHVFLVEKWAGEPSESEEMKPCWFSAKELPFDRMWSDDPYWVPIVLSGQTLAASFVFSADQKTIIEKKIEECADYKC